MVRYDSKRLEREHFLFNIPDHDIDSLSRILAHDLSQAGIGKRPYLIVAYSMGGVVARHMILNYLSCSNLRGVAFLGSPLRGSTMRDQINNDIKGIVPAFHRVLSPLENVAISNQDFNQHFMDSGFPLSKLTTFVDGSKHEADNARFLALGIRYICLIEAKKTYFHAVGKKYYFVPRSCAILEERDDINFEIAHKTHSNLQQAESREDQTFTVLQGFID